MQSIEIDKSNSKNLDLKKLLPIGRCLLLAASWIFSQTPTLAQVINISPDFKSDPSPAEKMGNGSVLATEITKQKETATGLCEGFIGERPDRVLKLTSFFNFLKVSVQSSQDTTIVVQGQGGTWCNGDYHGKNPAIAGQWEPGEYKVWIGSYKENIPFKYFLKITRDK